MHAASGLQLPLPCHAASAEAVKDCSSISVTHNADASTGNPSLETDFSLTQ